MTIHAQVVLQNTQLMIPRFVRYPHQLGQIHQGAHVRVRVRVDVPIDVWEVLLHQFRREFITRHFTLKIGRNK